MPFTHVGFGNSVFTEIVSRGVGHSLRQGGGGGYRLYAMGFTR